MDKTMTKVTTTGEEFTRFILDDEYWDDKYHIDSMILADGKDILSIDGQISDDSLVIIESGDVMTTSGERVMDITKFFNLWLAGQCLAYMNKP